MKLAAILLGIAAAGFAGVVAGTMLVPSPPPDVVGTEGDGRLLSRVKNLEAELERMRSQLEVARATAMRPIPAPDRPAVAPPTGEVAPETVATLAATPDSVLRDTVRSVIEEREQEQREARKRRLEEAVAEREVRMLEKLQERHGLTDNQRVRLRDLLTRRREELAAVPREERRQKERELRETYATEIKAIIGDEAFESFQRRFTPTRRGGGGRRTNRGGGGR